MRQCAIFIRYREPPNEKDLQKGAAIVKLGRTLVTDPAARETRYLETIAIIYDHWNETDHKTRLAKFEEASGKLATDFPDDTEAAIFMPLPYAQALTRRIRHLQNKNEPARFSIRS